MVLGLQDVCYLQNIDLPLFWLSSEKMYKAAARALHVGCVFGY